MFDHVGETKMKHFLFSNHKINKTVRQTAHYSHDGIKETWKSCYRCEILTNLDCDEFNDMLWTTFMFIKIKKSFIPLDQ
jgi:hypothetical protein